MRLVVVDVGGEDAPVDGVAGDGHVHLAHLAQHVPGGRVVDAGRDVPLATHDVRHHCAHDLSELQPPQIRGQALLGRRAVVGPEDAVDGNRQAVAHARAVALLGVFRAPCRRKQRGGPLHVLVVRISSHLLVGQRLGAGAADAQRRHVVGFRRREEVLGAVGDQGGDEEGERGRRKGGRDQRGDERDDAVIDSAHCAAAGAATGRARSPTLATPHRLLIT